MSAIARIIIELLLNLLVVRSADGLATLWNYCMDAIAPFLTLDVLTEMTSGHVAFFNTITESLRVVGFALTILLWLYGILRVESTLAEMKRPEAVFKHMLRLIIMIWIVQYAPEITKGIVDIGVKLAETLSPAGTQAYHLDSTLFNHTSVPDGDWSAGMPSSLLLTLLMWLVCFICDIGARIAILLCAYSIFSNVITRFFRMTLFYLVSPIAAAGIASEDTQRVTFQFGKNVVAVSSEMGLMILLLRIFPMVAKYIIYDNGVTGFAFITKIASVVSAFFGGFSDFADFFASQACQNLFTLLAAVLLFILLIFTLRTSIKGLNMIIDSLFGLHGV